MQHQETISVDALMDKYIRLNWDDVTISTTINQCISVPVLTSEAVAKRRQLLAKYAEQLQKLLKLPKVEQRSPEWFDMRKTMITASDFAQAIGQGKFGNQKQFFRKKCGYENETFDPYVPPLKWGVMYEPVATNIYANRQNAVIHDFGILRHETREYFGASPDGITDQGIMVEIKCPYARKITGEIPEQYKKQMQGQLEVCDLEECDYVECSFCEYTSKESFLDDNTCMQFERGIIIERTVDNTPCYYYSPMLRALETNTDILFEWLDKKAQEFGVLVQDLNVHYWKLAVYNVVRVYRNREATNYELDELALVWDKISQYKLDKQLYDEEVSVKKSTGPKFSEYMFRNQ